MHLPATQCVHLHAVPHELNTTLRILEATQCCRPIGAILLPVACSDTTRMHGAIWHCHQLTDNGFCLHKGKYCHGEQDGECYFNIGSEDSWQTKQEEEEADRKEGTIST